MYSYEHSQRVFKFKNKEQFMLMSNHKGHFFVNRVVQTCNSLQNSIVTNPSLISFKSAIDGQFKRLIFKTLKFNLNC